MKRSLWLAIASIGLRCGRHPPSSPSRPPGRGFTEITREVAGWLDRLAPEGNHYAHDDEGPDDMPAHLRAVLTGVNLSIPVQRGRMLLGTWQGIYLAEHRRAPHRREVALHVFGD